MNLKSIQRNYEHMSMLERLSLLDNAVARDDESEIKAVVAASPCVHYTAADFYDPLEKINKLRLLNLVVRLSYIMQFDAFCIVDESEEGVRDHARLSAYLYVLTTDSWRAVSEEFGLRPDFNERICRSLYSVEMLGIQDSILREFAFTESEAQNFVEPYRKFGKIRTLADEIKATREVLGLPKG